MGILDNIYVLNYIVNRQIGKKDELVVIFVDLKVAFDSVARRVLIETMRKKGRKEGGGCKRDKE